MKTLKTLALAVAAVGFLSAGAFAADVCDLDKEVAALKAAHDTLATGDDAAKAKAVALAKEIDAIKKEADKAKACDLAAKAKANKDYGVK